MLFNNILQATGSQGMDESLHQVMRRLTGSRFTYSRLNVQKLLN